MEKVPVMYCAFAPIAVQIFCMVLLKQQKTSCNRLIASNVLMKEEELIRQL